MTKYVYGLITVPDPEASAEELQDNDGYIAVALRSDYTSDELDEDINAIWNDLLCPVDETNFEITKGKTVEEVEAFLKTHSDLIEFDPKFQAFLKENNCGACYGWLPK